MEYASVILDCATYTFITTWIMSIWDLNELSLKSIIWIKIAWTSAFQDIDNEIRLHTDNEEKEHDVGKGYTMHRIDVLIFGWMYVDFIDFDVITERYNRISGLNSFAYAGLTNLGIGV